jgi:hypothetical protein
VDKPAHWPTGFPEQRFPTTFIEKHAAVTVKGRLFTSDEWADYLIFKFYPDQRVFLDGRSDFYGQRIGDDYVHLINARHDWRKIMARWNLDRVLAPVHWPLVEVLKQDPQWRVIADDGRCILLVRLGPTVANISSPLPPGNGT